MEPPTTEHWRELYNQLYDDFATMRAAVCCFIGARQKKTVTVGQWGIINDGPEGGCIGSSLTLTAGL